MKKRIVLSEPVIVAQGPTWEEVKWGPYQFPGLEMTDDGTIVCTFNSCADSETAYGTEQECYISKDKGETWTKSKLGDYRGQLGIRLPNGERLSPAGATSIPMAGLNLPKPIGVNRFNNEVYDLSEISSDITHKNWRFYRTPRDSETPVMEECELHYPYMTARSFKGVFVQPAARGTMHMGPDGTLWLSHYDQCVRNPHTGGFNPYSATHLMRSTDMGHTWYMVSSHLYHPDTDQDPGAFLREGYDENDITFAPDGSILQLIRTGSNSPCFFCRSTDGGKTFSKLQMFDTKGVRPRLLTLKCGVSLATYGRPGIWLKASDDPSGLEWSAPMALIAPPEAPNETMQNISCSYTYLLEIDDHTAMVAYTDFRIPDEQGVKRKTVLVRKITVWDE